MKNKIYLTICAVFSLLIIFIYAFNEHKFTAEYWLQNRIDKITHEPIKPSKHGLKSIKYRIKNNDQIDFEIEINDLGFLNIKRNSWHEDSHDANTYYYSFDPNKFITLEKKFKMQFPKSQIESIDDHFSGKYYELLFTDINNLDNKIEVAYYNLEPPRKFKDFKQEIIELTNESLNNSVKRPKITP